MAALQFEGKSVLIVGASRGIGAAAATAFAREGARLVLASRDLKATEALAASLPAGTHVRCLRADITAAEDMERSVALAVSEFGRLDVAFNNAGITQKRVPFAELSPAVFDAVLDTNVRGVFRAMQYQIRAMVHTGGGSIVNTGSIGSTQAMPQMGAYCTSKSALLALTKAAALDHAAQNVRVNLVAAGPVDTAMFRGGIGATAEGRAAVDAATPLRRVGSPEEIAEAVLWLASPAASYVTGALLPVDGGYTIG